MPPETIQHDGEANDHAALVYRWRLEIDGVVYHYAGLTIVREETWKKHKADRRRVRKRRRTRAPAGES